MSRFYWTNRSTHDSIQPVVTETELGCRQAMAAVSTGRTEWGHVFSIQGHTYYPRLCLEGPNKTPQARTRRRKPQNFSPGLGNDEIKPRHSNLPRPALAAEGGPA